MSPKRQFVCDVAKVHLRNICYGYAVNIKNEVLRVAKLLPDLSGEVRRTIGYRREMDVLTLLQQSLPDGYAIFHNVEWHSLYEGGLPW